MQKELLNQAVKIFDSSEKWDAFIELCNQRETIKSYYLQKLKSPLLSYFTANRMDGWVCEPWGEPLYDLCWYLQDFGKQSLCLAIGWRFQFHLLISDKAPFDSNKITELLKTKYSLLLTGFDRVDRQYEFSTKAMENRNYSFGSPYDSNFDDSQLDKLAWFAGNETEKFAEQIIKKVERFTKNEELTRMLYQLNAETKIQTLPNSL